MNSLQLLSILALAFSVISLSASESLEKRTTTKSKAVDCVICNTSP